ncbi:MAG: hypothetical protein HY812_20295 [Planctomycetes bacterium]|nr:hypothetical protein [Planctomycetota bacterium]
MDYRPPPLCPEDLLERSACVRRLAAQLVSDRSLREDVAQQTLDRVASAVVTVRAGETLPVELTLTADPEGR